MQPLPEPSTVLASLVPPVGADVARVALLIERAATAARRHTGGAGFTADGAAVEPDIADAIVASTRRALLNPELSLVGDGDAFRMRPGSFADWSFAEHAVLERYRAVPQTPGHAH